MALPLSPGPDQREAQEEEVVELSVQVQQQAKETPLGQKETPMRSPLPPAALFLLSLLLLAPVNPFRALLPLALRPSSSSVSQFPHAKPPLQASYWGAGPFSPFSSGDDFWSYLKPGTWVIVRDLGQPAQLVRNDGGGTYTLQLPPSSNPFGRPVLIRRHARDLSITNQQVRPMSTPGAAEVSQPKRPSPTPESPVKRLESSPGGYTLFQDPRTGKVYAMARPRLPEDMNGGRRLQYAPPRDQLKEWWAAPAPNASPRMAERKPKPYPGGDFVRDAFTQALENQGSRDKGAFELWRDLGRAQLLEGNTRQAQESYQKAYEADEDRFVDDDQILSELGEAQHREGRVRQAMDNYKKGLGVNSQNSRLCLKFAVSLHDQGNAPAAVPYYQKAIELDPSNLAAYNNLGVALQELGQYESALACFRQALQIDGLHGPALQNLAALTLRQGRVKLAVECIRRALLLDPNDQVARALLVQVMQAMSNRRSYQYPMLPGGVMDTAEDDERQRDKEAVEEGRRATGQWEGRGEEDEEGSAAEAERYLTWEEILRNAWKVREEMRVKKQQEEEKRFEEEQKERAKAREEARERARQMEERIQELFYGKPVQEEDREETNVRRESSPRSVEVPISRPHDQVGGREGVRGEQGSMRGEAQPPRPVQEAAEPLEAREEPWSRAQQARKFEADEERGVETAWWGGERPKAAGQRPRQPPGRPIFATKEEVPDTDYVSPSDQATPKISGAEGMGEAALDPDEDDMIVTEGAWNPFLTVERSTPGEIGTQVFPEDREARGREREHQLVESDFSGWAQMLQQQQQEERLQEEVQEPESVPVPGRQESATSRTEEDVMRDELLRERLRASVDAWNKLQRGAWAADEQRRNEAAAELQRTLERQQESKARQEAELRRAQMEQEKAEAEARKRRAELELQQRKAEEAFRMAKMVEDKARRDSEELRAQVEEDRANAVRRAWEEQLRAAVDEDSKIKQQMEARRMEAVQKAVESERLLLEQERQRAMVEAQVLEEKQQAEKALREKARLDELQEWERYRLRERQRQIAEWEERERIMEEKRRRVQAGLGLEVEEPTASRRQAEPQERRPEKGVYTRGQEEAEPSQELVPVSLPIMITRDMKRTLVEDLNYSLKDVNKLKPEEAVEIIQKGIRNPKKDFRRPGTSGPDELR